MEENKNTDTASNSNTDISIRDTFTYEEMKRAYFQGYQSGRSYGFHIGSGKQPQDYGDSEDFTSWMKRNYKK